MQKSEEVFFGFRSLKREKERRGLSFRLCGRFKTRERERLRFWGEDDESDITYIRGDEQWIG